LRQGRFIPQRADLSVFYGLSDATVRLCQVLAVVVSALADVFRAKIIDVTQDSVIVELTGNQTKIEAFLHLLDGYEVPEIARTGIAGLSRGTDNITYL